MREFGHFRSAADIATCSFISEGANPAAFEWAGERLDSHALAHMFATDASHGELRRRLAAEQSQPRYEPCLPRLAKEPPVGPGWIHEIKHDGFRILAHRRGRAIRLLSRNGHDLADRFPLAAEAIEALPVKSCVIDGEAIARASVLMVCFNAYSMPCAASPTIAIRTL
jgi:ATP-dependent DNA ligase